MTFSGMFSPYAQDIDPGTPDGAKLYSKAVKENCPEDKRIVVKVTEGAKLVRELTELASQFAWGKSVHKVPVDLVDILYPNSHTFLNPRCELSRGRMGFRARLLVCDPATSTVVNS